MAQDKPRIVDPSELQPGLWEDGDYREVRGLDQVFRTWGELQKVGWAFAFGTSMQEDGVRSTDMQFATQIDRVVDSLLLEFGVGYYKLSTNRENWNNEAYQLIKDRL